MACDPNGLVRGASCFQCLNEKQLQMVEAYSLAILAGVDPNPGELLNAAAPFQALDAQQLSMVQAYLLCKILGG